MSNYNVFLNNLKDSNQKNKLLEIYDQLRIEKEKVIRNEITNDHRHLELVNFCANLFKPFSNLSTNTDYQLLLYEPLNELNITNFDIAVYNSISKVLVLIECKSTFSYHQDKIDKIRKSITNTQNNIKTLESIIGDDIQNIEYVYCLPSNDAIELGHKAYSEKLNVCVWCYDGYNGEIKLYAYPEELTVDGIKNGRLHGDEKLLRILAGSIKSTFRAARSFSFLPSSHIFTILLDVIITLVRMMSRYGEWDGYFDFIDIYEIIKRNIAQPNTLGESNIVKLVENVIEIGSLKELIIDSTPSIVEKENKKYKLNNKVIKIRATRKIVDDNYVEINAIKLAKRNAVDRFKEETGYKDMTDYLQP